jgi:hypothetical protein
MAAEHITTQRMADARVLSKFLWEKVIPHAGLSTHQLCALGEALFPLRRRIMDSISGLEMAKVCGRHGYRGMVETILKDTRDITVTLILKMFVESCSRGHLDIAMLIYPSLDLEQRVIEYRNHIYDPEVPSCTIQAAFYKSCKHGHEEVAQWLLRGNNHLHLKERCKAFIKCCSEGHLQLVQWLYEYGCSNITALDKGFVAACGVGNVALCEWLSYQISFITNDLWEKGFKKSCKHGKVETVEWIFNKVKELDSEEGLFTACEHGKLEVVEWFVVNKHARAWTIDKALVVSCKYGRDEVVKWLMANTFRYDAKYCFLKILKEGDLDLAKLIRVKKTKKLGIKAFKAVYKHKHSEVARWVSETFGLEPEDVKDIINRPLPEEWTEDEAMKELEKLIDEMNKPQLNEICQIISGRLSTVLHLHI